MIFLLTITNNEIKDKLLFKQKKQSKNQPKFIPFEYCIIERAARMLEIEVDDILHFNETGYITLYIGTQAPIEEELMGHPVCSFYSYQFDVYSVRAYMTKGISLNKIFIKSHDLKILYESIYEGKELFKDTTPSLPKIKVGNSSKSQRDFIFALLELLPELKEKLFATPSKAPIIITEHFEAEDLAKFNPSLGDKNFSTWYDSHKKALEAKKKKDLRSIGKF